MLLGAVTVGGSKQLSFHAAFQIQLMLRWTASAGLALLTLSELGNCGADSPIRHLLAFPQVCNMLCVEFGTAASIGPCH